MRDCREFAENGAAMRFPILVLFSLCTAMTAIAAETPRAVPAYVEIKDWLAACDNTRFCDARGFSDDHPELSMSIRRQAGPEGRLEVTFESQAKLDPTTLQLDGAPLDAAGPWTSRSDGDLTSLVVPQQTAAAFLRSIRSGSNLSLGPVTGGKTAVLSLRGLAAVLLLMDDVQGRIGGVTALARPGPMAAAQVPAEPALPELRVIPPKPLPLSPQTTQALIAGVRGASRDALTKAECEPEDDVTAAHPGDEVQLLSPREALVLLECFRGAYQSVSLAFRVPLDKPDKAERLALSLPTEKSPTDTFFSAQFDPETGLLSMRGLGRGLGDCGSSASWAFDGKGFQIAAYAKQGRCGGSVSWPVLRRSTLRQERP